MAADMDEQMVQDRKSQRLTVIDPPKLSLGTQPARMLLVFGALVLAFAAGIASVRRLSRTSAGDSDGATMRTRWPRAASSPDTRAT